MDSKTVRGIFLLQVIAFPYEEFYYNKINSYKALDRN